VKKKVVARGRQGKAMRKMQRKRGRKRERKKETQKEEMQRLQPW